MPRLPALDRAGTLAAFVEAIRSGTEPETSGRRNLPTLALSLAAIRSAAERRGVEMSELLADLPEDVR
jgi:predicted dehydrogenase